MADTTENGNGKANGVRTERDRNVALRKRLNERLYELIIPGRKAKGEDANVDLGFLGVGFLRAVATDRKFRRKVRKELRGWDKEVRKSRTSAKGKSSQEGGPAS